MKKRIGVLTFVNADNFGAILQAYALSKYCSYLQFDVELINYRINATKTNYTNQIICKETILQKIQRRSRILKNHHRSVQIRKFNRFRSEFLSIGDKQYNGDEEFIKFYPDTYDYLICGSDQIWNTELSHESRTFYLGFKSKAKKIAYAGSYGHGNLSAIEQQYTKQYIPLLDAVSCREQESIREMKKICPNTDVTWVVDPVFLLDRKQWDEIAYFPREKDYIFVYTMEDSRGMKKTIENVRNQYPHKKIISVVGGCCRNPKKTKPKKEIGPREFVGLIANADAVITNSFHAAAFSVIYGKLLYLVEHSTRNLRLENLMNVAGVDIRLIIPNDGSCKRIESIGTNDALRNIQSKIFESKEFLKKALV